MHVLLAPSWYPLFPGDVGGSFFRQQAIALQESGLKVGVIAPQPLPLRTWKSDQKQRKSLIVAQDSGVATVKRVYTNWFPLLRRLRGVAFRRHGLALFKHYIARFGHPDLVHAHSMFYGGFLAADIHQITGIPFLITEHSTAFARRLYSKRELRSAAHVARLASARIAVSSNFAKLLSTSLGAHLEWTTIPNVLTRQAEDWVIHDHSPSKSGTTFINVSLMNSNKGLKYLLEAFARALALNPKLRLVLVGDGPEKTELQNLAKSLDVKHCVRFLGKLAPPETLAAISKADALIISSVHETFGVVAIEALALGKPVIATRCGGPESIVTSDCGILVDVGDVDSLMTAMFSVANNNHCYNPHELRRSCLSKYGSKAVVSQLRQVYAKARDPLANVHNRKTPLKQ